MNKSLTLDFDEFQKLMLAAGYDEVLERSWAANEIVPNHSHDFDANALVSAGEMWLAIGDEAAKLYRVGDHFFLPAGTIHHERYGAAGASYWVARKSRQ